jgi:uncharacterized protein YecE (DUF72 family)
MNAKLFLGCSGWNYGDPSDKGVWLNVFYPDRKTRKLNFYSQFFNTVEMDATFYKKFYLNMTKSLFIGLTKATPDNFKISVKVPEIVTHEKRLDTNKDVIKDIVEFVEKISPLKNTDKLGALIIQLPPSFAIDEFPKVDKFLEALSGNENLGDNNFAIEFRNKTWNTEGTFELLRHYDIASVLTDSPIQENLGFLSDENNLTSTTMGVVRLHGRNTSKDHYWYDYLYSEEELLPWVTKIKTIKQQTEYVFVYFNNHYGGKAIVNSLQFKELVKESHLTDNEKNVLEKARKYISNTL